MNIDLIQPVLLTYQRPGVAARTCLASYLTHLTGRLPPPIIIWSLASGGFIEPQQLALLTGLQPQILGLHGHEHGTLEERAAQSAWFALEQGAGYAHAADRQYVLYMENDIQFSSQMVNHLEQLGWPEGCGLYTLYNPEGRSDLQVAPHLFYGAQAIVLPLEVVQRLLACRADVERYPPNWDVQWARWIGQQGWKIHASERSYVQHLPGPSGLKCPRHFARDFQP